MCEACWVDGYGRPTDLPENEQEITDLIRELYAHPQGSTGGPLHVQIDDFNVHMEPWKPFNDFHPKDRYPEDLVQIAQRICDLMNPLPVSQRAAVVARWEGWF